MLLDLGLPGLNGYDVAKQVRMQPSCQRRKLFIAVTEASGKKPTGNMLQKPVFTCIW